MSETPSHLRPPPLLKQICGTLALFPVMNSMERPNLDPVLPDWDKGITVLSLPEELLARIFMELGVYGTLRARATCRLFDRISHDRQVWCGLFTRGIGTLLPKPFFLSNPLYNCSAGDIEGDIRRWEAGWTPQCAVDCTERLVETARLGGIHAKVSTVRMLPGGRWLISGYSDGSLWYFDLLEGSKSTGTLTPKPLLPSPCTGTQHGQSHVHVDISVDSTSVEALGSSLDVYHLRQFHIAVVVRPSNTDARACVDVWRNRVLGEEDHLEGSCHLSSFTEGPALGKPLNCSLYGLAIAYTMSRSPTMCFVVVVNWAGVHEATRSKDIVRHYLPGSEISALYLLPGDMLLKVSFSEGDVRLYDWSSDSPTSTPAARPVPIWRGLHRRLQFEAVSQPMIIGDSIRLTLAAVDVVLGLTLPLTKPPERVRVQVLLEGKIHTERDAQAFGAHRGLGWAHSSKLLQFQYRWAGEPGGSLICPPRINSPRLTVKGEDMGRPTRLVYDQYSNRAVATDYLIPRLLILGLSS